VIRAATVEDAPALGALAFAASHAGYGEFADDLRALPDVADQVADWRRHLAAEGAGWTWVAEDDDAIVGLVTGSAEHVDELMVLPDRVGRGIGSALLAHIEAAAGAEGTTSMTLRTYTANARARGLYEQRGWVLDGDAEDGRLGPQVQYRKALTA
jgi:GNAT superfamily N-acetyltransferase